MTTLIQQKSDNDCVLAAIAMAKGCERWEDLWSEELDLAPLIGKGVQDTEDYLTKTGFVSGETFKAVYTYGDKPERVAELLWRRRALVSVNSYNNGKDGHNHMVYWDGTQVWDPNDGRPDKQVVRHLRSTVIKTVYLLA